MLGFGFLVLHFGAFGGRSIKLQGTSILVNWRLSLKAADACVCVEAALDRRRAAYALAATPVGFG